jgi:hypothetical protein
VLAELFTPWGKTPQGDPYVPIGITFVRVVQEVGRQVWVHGRRSSGEGSGVASLAGDLLLLDEAGQVVAEVRGSACSGSRRRPAPRRSRSRIGCTR